MDRRPERAPLDCYLDRICRRLWLVPARERRDTREELRQHLEKMAAHAARTVEPTAAMEDAMEKFGDPKQIGSELSRQHLRRRRWLSALLKTAAGAALTLTVLMVGYSVYWYFALSRPMESETAPTPIASAAATLTAIQASQDSYARQIQSVRFQGVQEVHTSYQGHPDKTVPHTYQVAPKDDKSYSRDVSNARFGNEPNQMDYQDDVYVSDGHTLRENLTEWNGRADSTLARRSYGYRVYLRDNSFKPHDADEVLQFGYKVHGVWIGDMLRRGQPVVEGTTNNPQFGPLTIVRCWNRSKWGTEEAVRLWLSPKLGWLAVKTEAVEADARPPFALRTVYEAQNIIKAGTFWVADEGRFHYDALGLGRREEVTDHTQRFTNIAFNDVPDSLFVAHYPVGTRALSADFQTVSILQPSGQWKEEPSDFASSAGPQWPLIVAVTAVLGGVGLAVLRVWRRGRRLAA